MRKGALLLISRGVYIVCVVFTLLLTLGDDLLVLLSVLDTGRGLGSQPVGNFVRMLRMLIFFVKNVIVITVVISGSPTALFTKLNTSTTVLVLIFGSDVLNFITNVRLSTGSVVHPNS